MGGFVTVESNGSLQIAVLEQLAAQAGFAIIAGRVDARPITLQFERVALLDAIDLILDGLEYTVEYDFDEASGARYLAQVAIGDTTQYRAAEAEGADSAARAVERREPVERVREAPSEEQAEMLAELDNPDPEARADAVFWIDLEGEALDQLISMLQSDPDAEVRASIVERLGEEESPAATAAVTAALQDRDPEVVLRAIETLEFDAGDWLIPELERLLAHPDPEVRETAEDAILYLK
ncbi:MAG: HEAT repeat domain-containing protein [Deltaproteobacteria bacterium]|nr:HEAT repeat domain-containing protein [Deltaproteobacteria bacterium]